MGSPELLTVSLCRGVWLCWAGWSCLPAPGTLLSWGGGIWGTLRLEGVHGGLKTAEWAHIAGSWPQVGGQVCTSGCGCAGGKHTPTHPPLMVAARARVDTPLCRCAQTLNGTRTEQLSNYRVG